MAKKTSKESIVHPLVQVAGEKHILQEMFDSDDAPEMKSVGYMKIGKATHSWVSYTMTTKGDQVLKIEIDEPNMKQIAEESAKISFVQTFIDQEF